jgi:molybdate transport system substrate-binding protein
MRHNSGITRVAREFAALFAAVCLMLLGSIGCGSGEGRPQITVAAAADLRYAFEELEVPFEGQCGCDLVLTFGSSGKFATQIEEGLPADVFASANVSYVDDLEKEGLILPGTQQVYAVGRIVLAVPRGSSLDPADLSLVANPAVKRLAIANPDHAPYGVAAKEAMESAGLWDAVQDKLVFGEDAAQASQFVETGDAEAGIIPLSLAVQRHDKVRYTLIDDRLHNPLWQAAAVVAGSSHADIGEDFINFINSPEGRPVMVKYGFVLPGEAPSPLD